MREIKTRTIKFTSNLILKSGLMYNKIMVIHPIARDVLLEDAAARDRKTARRFVLLKILFRERYLTREQLVVRVEGELGKGCFGDSAWEDTFYRDMLVVKKALRAAGYQPAYSRRFQNPGYYLRNQPPLDGELASALKGSIAEADPSQIAIFKKLTPGQRFQQGCSITNLASRVVSNRIRQQNPQLSPAEAHRMAVQKKV